MPTQQTKAYKNQLAKQAWFAALTEVDQEDVLDHSQVLSASPQTNIITQDSKQTHLYFVLEGKLRSSRSHENGREMIIDLIDANTLLGLTALFDNGYSPATLQATTHTTLLAIPATQIQHLVRHAPLFATELLAIVAENHSRRLNQLSQITLHSAEERLGNYILNHMFSEGDEPHTTLLPAAKAIIAQQLGMTPETFSRTLAQLKKRGIVVKKNEVSIVHDRALCPFCETSLARRCRHGNSAECPLNQQNLSSQEK